MAKTTFYQRTYMGWPAVKIKDYTDPDSNHWENRALDMKHWLILKMGKDEFKEWADRLFPDDTIEQATWKEIWELYKAKFESCIGNQELSVRG